jgi:hypothetical protein
MLPLKREVGSGKVLTDNRTKLREAKAIALKEQSH